MNTFRGLAVAFALFVAGFALHIVGGALDLDWVFAFAVAVAAVSAVGFPTIAALGAGRTTLALAATSSAAGLVLTSAVLWAANDREFAAWTIPLGLLLVVAVNVPALALLRSRPRRPAHVASRG